MVEKAYKFRFYPTPEQENLLRRTLGCVRLIYNAEIKSGQSGDYWDDNLAAITEKRNLQMRDHVNKAARFVINWCIEHQIGTVVFGWNQRQKDSINIGKKITNSLFKYLQPS
ncbi:MAG: helix-turn-helix domain-containing protein [Okeania sp. SIO1H6]|uniref:Transposase putative helix-turn-helix domain-containing protein n=1 Tax=Okeania hirsuta TaxID=1458930 RepID=A0A3N6P4C7_9CYAN|nr:helix-turn-helix domain-containing protein [Okeania sp. SIO1H4]NES90558.1 helix-turn-helix domain-containing protein [Okeania sp. SIO2B9]NET14129.1 helix-turn-helix domain-containing protein [Okeania sp. SIO1H6]NET23489.1 helix-turn-helix domain-containing protein [Okeania sp. SIO1H5]NET80298.1 helix-turn-helix domain-containing protein [Okeania sp. SIO1F9]NET94811.1 helix-turn-helix domain-containing protein [Okeania sp. SIO1H2]RQH21681.1 hypothetical protein D4Z78_09290 [Okeania hirsuta]